jgi:hypothetical protein
VVSADFNNDGKEDLAVANKDNNTVSVLLNNGSTIFQTSLLYDVGSEPSSLVSGDFNNDNTQDLIVTNEGSNDLSIFLNIC